MCGNHSSRLQVNRSLHSISRSPRQEDCHQEFVKSLRWWYKLEQPWSQKTRWASYVISRLTGHLSCQSDSLRLKEQPLCHALWNHQGQLEARTILSCRLAKQLLAEDSRFRYLQSGPATKKVQTKQGSALQAWIDSWQMEGHSPEEAQACTRDPSIEACFTFCILFTFCQKILRRITGFWGFGVLGFWV